jgi:hypothetical protein
VIDQVRATVAEFADELPWMKDGAVNDRSGNDRSGNDRSGNARAADPRAAKNRKSASPLGDADRAAV